MEPNLLGLYQQMLRSRRFEEAVSQVWREGRISAEMHLGIGEEGIVAGVIDHLRDGDAIALDHRGTAPLVMRGADLTLLLKEFMGHRDGLCHGMGGHMHLYMPEFLAASSGIVGAAGPAACGFAYAAQLLRPGNIAVAFFGEAAMNQGMLLEAINLASAWSLPVLFVCKDNAMAITTPSKKVTGGNLVTRAKGLGAPAESVDGADVEAVWREAGTAISRARDGGGPSFLQATCVRPEGHFLGDPLIRIARKPARELKDKIGPLMKAATEGDASIGQRAASLGSILSIIGKAARTQIGQGDDPLLRLRKKLVAKVENLATLESQIETEVARAVESASEEAES